MTPIGKIRNEQYVSRKRDFSGLRYGPCTPTDIDALLELDDEVFIFIEAKYKDTTMSKGQRLALERMTDAIAHDGRHAIALVVSHGDEDVIDYAQLPVRMMRESHGSWIKPVGCVTTRDACDAFISQHRDRNRRSRPTPTKVGTIARCESPSPVPPFPQQPTLPLTVETCET